MFVELPSKEAEDIWIRAGVAAFLSLRYWVESNMIYIF